MKEEVRCTGKAWSRLICVCLVVRHVEQAHPPAARLLDSGGHHLVRLGIRVRLGLGLGVGVELGLDVGLGVGLGVG